MKPSVTRQRPGVKLQEVPLKIVGGNKFGRYPKISDESAFNLLTSDGWLVPYAGYKIASAINKSFGAVGRAIYTSERWGHMIVVISNMVYGVNLPASPGESLSSFLIGQINTYSGDVFIDENIGNQIAICDGKDLWIFNWLTPSNPALISAILPIEASTGLPILPGYVTYQDGYFIVPNSQSASWYLSAPNNGLSWNWSAISGPVNTSIQTKATNAVAALRAPSRGNLLYVFGRNVTEMWYDQGLASFPYQRNSSVSIDYGCLSPSTIAAMDSVVAWLGINERSGPVIMMSEGADVTRLSNDGIDFKLSTLVNPERSYGFFFKQDGHLFYQLTFIDPKDNFSLVYDFNTQSFFYATDELMNYHIAARMAFFGNDYYFVSLRDGYLYNMSSDLTQYDYTLPEEEMSFTYEIPRKRVCAPVRLPDSSNFVVNNLNFTVEQGNDPYFSGVIPGQYPIPYQPRIDLSVSRDGGENYGSIVSYNLKSLGNRQNRVAFWRLGSANDFVVQLHFISKSRTVVTDGILVIYQ